MAKSNFLGASNLAAGPGEVGYMPAPGPAEAAPEPVAAVEAAPEPADPDPPVPPPASALKAEHAAYAAAALGVPAEEAESMTKPELVELAKNAAPSLTSSGDDG